MYSNRAIKNFENYVATTPKSQLGYVSAAGQHGFPTPVRPVGAFDATTKRPLRRSDFERGGALDAAGEEKRGLDGPAISESLSALQKHINENMDGDAAGTAQGLLENLLEALGADNDDDEGASDDLDPRGGKMEPRGMDGRQRAAVARSDRRSRETEDFYKRFPDAAKTKHVW